MEEKPTHTIVLAPHDGSKRIFHSVTAKNVEDAAIKARIWLVERRIHADIKMVIRHGLDSNLVANSHIVFHADRIDPAAQDIMEGLGGEQV